MSALSQEISLYDLALNADPPIPFIQVSPRGFKALVHSMVDFLVEQKIQAALITKLPIGDLWQDDLQRYLSHADLPQAVYQFVRLSTLSTPDALEKEGSARTIPIPYPRYTIPTASSLHLSSEYLILILGQGFAGMMLARRFQADEETSPIEVADLIKDGRQYLRVTFSINPVTIRSVLQSLSEIVRASAQEYPHLAVLAELAATWETQFPDLAITPLALTFLDQLLLWHLEREENLRQSAANYRRQAMEASSLSSQNEVLLSTLQSKDDFLSTVGQALRTPITTIKTALTLLSSPSLKPAQRQRYMDMISTECDRQSTLITSVLDLLQIERSLGTVRPDPIQLFDTVPAVVSTYQPLAQEQGIMLAYTIPNNLPPVACPDAWMRQIMIHLLHNGIKFTPPGGQVWVKARRHEDFVEIDVQDTGAGIPSNELPRIFEHFYRGRQPIHGGGEGAGLGLTIVHQLLLYCGGMISVESQIGEGTTFHVQLPIYESGE